MSNFTRVLLSLKVAKSDNTNFRQDPIAIGLHELRITYCINAGFIIRIVK